MDHSILSIDHGSTHFCPLCIRASEVADVLSCELRIKAGDKNCRAHDFRKSRGVMCEWIAGRRHVQCVKFE